MAPLECMNCGLSTMEDPEAIEIKKDGQVLASVCTLCQEGVQMLRLTVNRSHPQETFKPLQYQCVEAFKPRKHGVE